MSALGSLVVKLALEYAQFSQGLNSTEQEVKQHAKRVQDAYEQMSDGVTERMGRLKGAVVGALAGAVSVGGLIAAMSKIKQETIDAEQEQNQLAAAIKSTGESAGWSQERLNDMAAALGKNSNFSEGLINQAQTRLLSYTGVVREQFPRAMQAILDMSARLNTEVTASAETIGKALDIPSEGLTALSKQGFRFSDEQKDLVKRMERAGETAAAQGIILDALESSYGGAAKAARDSFGGAMTAVGETLNSLMTADSASLPGLRASVEGLNETLNSDDVRQGFQSLVGSLVDIGTFTASSVAGIVSLGQTVAEHKGEIGVLIGTLAGAGTAAGAMKVAAAIGGAGGVVGAIAKVRAAFLALTIVMAANPVGLLLLGVGAATGAAIAMNSGEPTGDRLTKEIENQAKRLADAEALLEKAGGPKKNFTEKLEARIEGIRGHLETLRAAAGVATPQVASVAVEVAGVAQAAEGTGATLGKSEDWIKKYGTTAEKAALEVAEWKKKLGAAFTPEMQSQIEAAFAKQDASARAGAQSAKQLETAYTGLTGSIAEKIAEQRLELVSGKALNDADKMRIKFQQDLRDSLKGLSPAKQADTLASLKTYEALIEENTARKQAIELLGEEQKFRQELWAAQAKTVEELEAGNKSLRDEIPLIGLSVEQQSILLRQREEAILLVKEQHLAELKRTEDASGFMSRERIMLEQEIALRRERLQLMGEKGAREAHKTVADLVKSDWENVSKTIGSTLSDYIMGGGKDAAQYLKRLFATLVLQPVVNYGANSVSGLLGLGSQGKDVNSVLGGNNVGTTVLNNAGAIGAGYQAIYGASVGASSASLLGANAVGMAGGDALGALIAGNGMWAGVATGAQATAQAAVAANMALEAGTAVALEAGTLGTAIGTGATTAAAGAGSMMAGVMAAAPYLAAVVALYAIISGMDDSGTPHMGAGATYSKATGVQGGADVYNKSTFGMGHRDEYSETMQAGISGIAQGLGQTLDQFAISFGQQAGYSVATAFADDSSKDGSWGSLKVVDALGKVLVDWTATQHRDGIPREFADGAEGYKEYLKQVAIDIKTPFMAMDAPKWSKDILKVANDIDTLTSALQQIAAIRTVFDGLGKTMVMFADLSGDLQTRLLYASGGIDALAQNAGAFYEKFYSEQERAQKQRELQMQSLAGMGLYIDPFQGDAAKEMFRLTVEEAMKSEQMELAARLMAMSTPFGAIADYGQKIFDDLADAAKDAADLAEEAAEKAKEDAEKVKQAAADALDVMAGLAQGFVDQMTAAHSAMDTAGALWDRLDAAQGGSGTGYARIREQRLWDAMVQADYKQQIELAGELTDIVLNRHQLEQANATKLLDFGKSLRSYVDGLKIGSLSPLTMGQKLAEAAKQWADTLAKADAGDETARGALQGASTSYLDLARQYYASSGDYTKIFNTVSGSLDALGLSSQTEAQQQLNVSSQSLAQLQQLQGILWDAYGQAESEFAVEKDLLQRQVDEMLRTANGVDAVRELLGGMPAELATLLNGGAAEGTGSFATLAQNYVSLLGGVGGSSTDARYVASAMGHMDAANWKYELSNALGLLEDPGARTQMQAIFDAVAKMKGIDGSHASGLAYVPFDNYIGQLHKGERVLTAEENRAYSSTWSSYGRSDGMAAMASEIKVLNGRIESLTQQNERLMGDQIRATLYAADANAGRVVDGFGRAAALAAHAQKIQGGYR